MYKIDIKNFFLTLLAIVHQTTTATNRLLSANKVAKIFEKFYLELQIRETTTRS